MKNLVKTPVEKLELLPSKSRKHQECWGYWHEYRIKGKSVYKTLYRILNNNIGKSFDLAFSYYCKQVSKKAQRLFLREFDTKGFRYYGDYYLDENNLIQCKPYIKSKKTLSVRSLDLQTERRHKITGHLYDAFTAIYDKTGRRWGHSKPLYYIYMDMFYLTPIHKRYVAYEEDFINVILQGWYKEFETKKDPEYKRLTQENQKARRKRRKELNVKMKEYQESLLHSICSKRREKEKQEKIVRKGFDPITSFRNDR